MKTRKRGLRRFVGALVGAVSISATAIAILPAAAGAATAAPAPVCQSNGFYPGGNTCIQLVPSGFGSYSVVGTGTTANAVPSGYVTLTGPGGGTTPGTPVKLAAKGTATVSSGAAAGAGTWCASFTVTAPIFGFTLTATNSPAPCVTVPPLPAPSGSGKQVCLDPAQFPQFETCIDVAGAAVVAKGYSTTSGPTGWLTLTSPAGVVSAGPTAPVVAGAVLTFAGPTPAAHGQWCANFFIKAPALGNLTLDVTGKTPVCLTV